MTLLSVQNLNMGINGNQILHDVSLQIDEGVSFGIVGESGSGKSMTALSVMGLLPASGVQRSGQIVFSGRDLGALSERQMCAIRGKNIGMIFQEPMTALNPVKTIGHQVAEPLIQHRHLNANAAKLVACEKLERVGLPASRFPLYLFPHELSGGQRQRVCIALAIALCPRLLIADEPTTALDVSTQSQILKLLRSLVDEDGMSLMLITHDLAVIADMTKEAVVMQNGRIVEYGKTEQLFRNMRHPYTKRLFAAHQFEERRKLVKSQDVLLRVSSVVREYKLRNRRSLLKKADVKSAVTQVSFDLFRGESLGLVGESGCGKSTLARAILGLDSLQSGSITLDGDRVSVGAKMRTSIRRKMQVVFQDPYGSFNPRHQVGQLVSEPFYLIGNPYSKKERLDRVAVALEEVGLSPSDMTKFIHEFSGGQRQRIAIARSLVLRPSLIVLDEAVSALDVSIRTQILNLLNRLQDRHGLSYLFISHDLLVVKAVTDRVMVMQNGQIVEEGQTSDVFAAPQHPHTKMLLAASPQIPEGWKPADDSPTSTQNYSPQ